jgi:hypothetical protein
VPRILNGWWAAGVGGGIASVGRLDSVTPIAQFDNAGGTCWLRPGLALFQHGSHLETFDVSNGEHNETFDPQGCFQLAAGGGVYAANYVDGVRVSNQGDTRYFLYGVGDVSPEGNVVLLQPNGTLLGQLLTTIQAVEAGGIIALDSNRRPFAANGAVAPVALPGKIGGLRVHGDLCIYHAEEQHGKLILQYRDRLVGVVLADGLTKCYRPDFEDANGVISVLYATEEGEAPTQLRLVTTRRAAFGPLTDPALTLEQRVAALETRVTALENQST